MLTSNHMGSPPWSRHDFCEGCAGESGRFFLFISILLVWTHRLYSAHWCVRVCERVLGLIACRCSCGLPPPPPSPSTSLSSALGRQRTEAQPFVMSPMMPMFSVYWMVMRTGMQIQSRLAHFVPALVLNKPQSREAVQKWMFSDAGLISRAILKWIPGLGSLSKDQQQNQPEAKLQCKEGTICIMLNFWSIM